MIRIGFDSLTSEIKLIVLCSHHLCTSRFAGRTILFVQAINLCISQSIWFSQILSILLRYIPKNTTYLHSLVCFVSEAITRRCYIKRCSYQKFIKLTRMRGIELASSNKNQIFVENTLHFKPRITLTLSFNVQKWIILKPSVGDTARFLKQVWPFFIIMHERVEVHVCN